MSVHDDATEVRAVDAHATLVQPSNPFAVGQRVNDRYLLEEVIGAGGFGQVFRARDDMLGRVVALKTILTGRRAGGDPQRLLDEARTVARLDHPNIIPIYDVGIADGIPWMAMKLIDGEGLERLLRSGPLPRERAFEILAQTARALDHAHRRGIVHRDIKPSNIIVSHSEGGGDHAWLADFGIAKILGGDSGAAEEIAGTPAYMAPEQITGKRVDARTDVFALGCVAVEALTGLRAFQGGSYSELVYRIVHDEPNGLAQVRAAAGSAAEAAVKRALAKSPEDRVQTAAELVRMLTGGAPEPKKTLTQRLLTREVALPWDGRYVVAAEGVEKGYGWRSRVVKNASLHIERGAIFALLGRNGSGKTTLLRTLLGIYRRDAGRVALFGRDPEKEGPAILARVGYVSESLPVYDTLRVGELLTLMSRVYAASWGHALAYSLLGRYKLPLTTKVKALSRGMRTQLGLVCALAHRPELLVLDDPTLGLDAVVLDDFFATLAEISRKEGTTVLMASHNIGEMESIATHVGLFADGHVILADTLAGLRTRTREVRLTFRDDVPPELTTMQDFRTVRSSGRHVTGVILDDSTGALDRIKALHPDEIEVRELGLKEIFINFMREQ
jgi:ABC-type multidrug transport system ATPase subunit